MAGKELSSWLSACAVLLSFCCLNCLFFFPVWCLGHSIVWVPDHFSSFVFLLSLLGVFGHAEYIFIFSKKDTRTHTHTHTKMHWYRYANPSEVQCIVSRLMMSLEFLLLTCCADLSTGDQLIIRRKYPNAPESELSTGDTSEWQSLTRTLTREISPQLSPEKWTWQLHPRHLRQKR